MPRLSNTRMAFLGLLVSLYAVHVEYKLKTNDEEFTALCDIQQIGASCSAVFALPEGHLLSYFGLVERHSHWDIPNALIGCFYYIYMLALSGMFPLLLTKTAASMAFLTTIFLAYQLTFTVQELCLVCWTTHVLNALLWYNTMFASTNRQKVMKM